MKEELSVDDNSSIEGARYRIQKAEELKRQTQASNFPEDNSQNIENDQTARITEIAKTARAENEHQLQINE